MQQLSQLDYEAIENAVMETARGRWFLSEYKKRHAGASTTTLLDAISRLEKVVTTLGDGSYQSAKADGAIAPEVSSAPVTPAEKVKKFVAPTPFFSGGKDVKNDTIATEQTPLNDENLKFFSNDEDLFSDDANDLLPDASVQNIETTDVKPVDLKPIEIIKEAKAEVSTLDAETTQVSDRFKVFRTDTSSEVNNETSVETDSAKNDVIAAEVAESQADEPALDALFGDSTPSHDDISKPKIDNQEAQAPVDADPIVVDPIVSDTVVPDPAIQATDEEKDRIVIIRGTSDKSIDIPFADDIFGDISDKPSVS